jgi:hypothetical protein
VAGNAGGAGAAVSAGDALNLVGKAKAAACDVMISVIGKAWLDARGAASPPIGHAEGVWRSSHQ